MRYIVTSLLFIIFGVSAFAGNLQNKDFATPSQITGAGGSLSQLLNIPNIWDTVNSQQLSVTIANLSTTSLATTFWSVYGNSGTNTATNFLGTTDAQDVILKRNATEKLRLISSGIQAANIYGDTAASGNILIDSTTNATKGNVNLGQSYKEYTSGKIRFGSVGSAVPANSDIAYNTPNHKISFFSSGGQEWQQVINDSRMFFWPFGASMIGLGVNTSNEVMAGDASGYKLTVSNNSATTVAGIGALGVSGSQPIVAIENMNATVNNFTGLMFRNQNDAWIAGMFGINENHNVIGSATGHEEIWTRNAGTAARAMNIAADKTITMDKYGAGVAQFDASGVVSSTAPGASGNVLTSNGTAWISSASAAGGGSVTSVGLSLPSIFVVSGSPVTTSGTLTGTLSLQSAGQVFAGPTAGGAASPSFRALVASDIPSLSALYLPLTGGTMSGQIDMGINKIVNLATPTANLDAANKLYVDNGLAALNPKEAVYAASTATIVGTYSNGVAGIGATFTVTATGALSLDGTNPPLGERVLLKNQASGLQNGIYDVTVVGALGVSPILTRSLDYNQPSEMNDAGVIPVINGTVNAVTSWVQTATIANVGVDSLVFTQWTMNPSSYLQKANNLSDVSNATSSFKNISPLSATGDLIVYNGTNNVRLPVGANTYVLTADSTQSSGVKWAASSGGGGASGSLNSRWILNDAIVPYVNIDGPHYQGSAMTLATVSLAMLNSGTSGSTIVQLNQYRAGSLLSSATASLAASSGNPASSAASLSSTLNLSVGDVITCDVNSIADGSPESLSIEY